MQQLCSKWSYSTMHAQIQCTHTHMHARTRARAHTHIHEREGFTLPAYTMASYKHDIYQPTSVNDIPAVSKKGCHVDGTEDWVHTKRSSLEFHRLCRLPTINRDPCSSFLQTLIHVPEIPNTQYFVSDVHRLGTRQLSTSRDDIKN